MSVRKLAAALRGLNPGDREAIRRMLRDFAGSAEAALRSDLLGIYVSGSLTMGDFQSASSDIDFLAVTARPFTEADLPRVAAIHTGLAGKPFGDRLEGSYAAASRLHAWGIDGDLVSAEPGAPPQICASEYSADNMWALRYMSVALHGAPPASILPEVDAATVRGDLRDYLKELLVRPADTSQQLSSIVLNIARCLYGIEIGQACTKQDAVTWLIACEPSLAAGVSAALGVRRGQQPAGDMAAMGDLVRQMTPLARKALEEEV